MTVLVGGKDMETWPRHVQDCAGLVLVALYIFSIQCYMFNIDGIFGPL